MFIFRSLELLLSSCPLSSTHAITTLQHRAAELWRNAHCCSASCQFPHVQQLPTVLPMEKTPSPSTYSKTALSRACSQCPHRKSLLKPLDKEIPLVSAQFVSHQSLLELLWFYTCVYLSFLIGPKISQGQLHNVFHIQHAQLMFKFSQMFKFI